MRLDDGAGAAAHHRQVHHQTEGFPIHQVGGGAVVGAGEVFALLDPGSATDPQPAAGGQGFLLQLHTAQQVDLVFVEVAQFLQAAQVALGYLLPAFTAAGGLAGIGAVEDWIGRWGRGGEVRPGGSEGLPHRRGAWSRN